MASYGPKPRVGDSWSKSNFLLYYSSCVLGVPVVSACHPPGGNVRLSLISLALSGLALLPVAAKADTLNYTLSSSGVTVNGTLDATNNGDGSYTITGINGAGITGPVNSALFPTDNLLFPTSDRMLDVLGVGFTYAYQGMDYAVNLYSNNSPSGFSYYADAYDPTGNLTAERIVNFDVTPAAVTPEPSSLLLLSTGMAALAAFGVRKRLIRL